MPADRELLLDELARCFARAAVDAYLDRHAGPDTNEKPAASWQTSPRAGDRPDERTSVSPPTAT
jgi:hypothetical protein